LMRIVSLSLFRMVNIARRTLVDPRRWFTQLELEQQRLGGDGADATGAKEPREGDQLVDGKDEDLSHRANRTIIAGTRKTARRVRIASHCEFATYNLSVRARSVLGGSHHEHLPAYA